MAAGEIPRRISLAFLGRHGGRPRAIQEYVWREFRPDSDGVVIAPTGHGKTEAVFMPIASELIDDARGSGRLRVLVISPTRALATDLHKRLAPVFRDLGLRLDVATSDRNSIGTSPSDLLIRTPEGIDSVLCRAPESFAHLKAVIIDEIHTYLGNPRGTQVVGLLTRLDSVSKAPRRLGVSATIDDPVDLTRFGLLRDPVVVEESDDRSTTMLHFHPWLGSKEQAAFDLVSQLRTLGVRKAIGFVQTRARAEEICSLLNRGYLERRCFVHHAGLSTSLRREAEERFRTVPVGVIVATTTLEVGIDIGSVDACILFDAPPSTAAYRQRIGRAGRRSGLRTVIAVTELYDRRFDFARVIDAPHRRISGFDARPCMSGVIQQLLSVIAQHRGLDGMAAVDFLTTAFGLPEAVGQVITGGLVESGWLVRQDLELKLAPRAEALLATRQLHMTFALDGGAAIQDESTGKYLGRATAREGASILLGGKARRVTGVNPKTGVVLTRPERDGEAAFGSAAQSPFAALASRMTLLTGGACQPC